MEKSAIIEKLRNDNDYYGDFGKQFRSNSEIIDLLTNPMQFGKPKEKTTEMLNGSYMHIKMLEPAKLKEFEDRMIVNASTRNTNIYKDALAASGEDVLLLRHETEIIDELCKKMKGNMSFYEEIYASGNKFEEPMVVELFGNTWKCKADILSPFGVPDIKTTSDINKFKSSAWTYNYDSAAYIYEKAFGVPMVFLVGCKKTGQLGRFTCSEEFIARGEQKVIQATSIYNRYFGPNATEDISEYMIEQEL